MEILHEINGKKYVLFTFPVTNSESNKNLGDKCKKHNCIMQGVKEVNRGGLFSNAFVIVNVLVPEENAISFSNED